MRPDDNSCYIVHMLNPIAIIGATDDANRIKKNAIQKTYQYQNAHGFTEEWTLFIHHFFTTDFLTEPEEQAIPLLNKAWRWYRAYMEWEDKNIDLDDYAAEN